MKIEIGKAYDLGPMRLPVRVIGMKEITPNYTKVTVKNLSGKRVGLIRTESLAYLESVAVQELKN